MKSIYKLMEHEFPILRNKIFFETYNCFCFLVMKWNITQRYWVNLENGKNGIEEWKL